MVKRSFASLLAIMLVVICGGFGLTTANASYPILKLERSGERLRLDVIGYLRKLETVIIRTLDPPLPHQGHHRR